jgi:HlyD family secretion protein
MPAELEATELELQSGQQERSLALERRRASWAEGLAEAEQQIVDLQGVLATRNSDQSARYITAPLHGTIEELMPLSTGSVVRAGDAVITISPEGPIVADALVAPRDVGYLRAGMPARLLIDGYDVQEWGSADAVVSAVAQDYTLAGGHPAFRVRLQLLHGVLRRANGSVAPLGKGLRCQVRFLIGRKRITDIIRRRTSEWLDPVSLTER